jgi:hypothetical protein
MVIVAASQVGSWVGLDSLEDLNQPNMLLDLDGLDTEER